MKQVFILPALLSMLVLSGCGSSPDTTSGPDDIRPYTDNPRYWQYKGSPVLLLGGTKDDNLFQVSGLEEHLDLLQSVGGNYIRNTMSSRDTGNLWPFYLQPDGKYDLDRWNEDYWKKFESLLKWTSERDIIVQIEIWDRFDYSREPWDLNPFNAAININYTETECGMEETYPRHPSGDLQPFFHSIPGMPRYTEELDLVRKYQEKFVDKILSYSLDYGNVLYCMDNETSTPPEWGKYWMHFITKKAGEKSVYTTDMFDKFFRPNLCPNCLSAIKNPDEYEFLDVSQINSRNFDRQHWDTLAWIIGQRELYPLRPVNCVKVYGGMNSTWGSGTNEDGVERFARDVFGGCAAVRHHRPPHGNGLNARSQASIRSIRKLETLVKMWELTPHMEGLSDAEGGEVYLTSKKGEQYIVLFPDGGKATLDLSQGSGTFSGRWISIGSGEWGDRFSLNGGGKEALTSPGPGGWIAVIYK